MFALGIIVAIGLFLMVIERLFPAQKLPEVKGWWLRVIFINLLQLGFVFIGMVTWETWFVGASLFDLRDKVSPLTGGIIAYFCSTFIFYWWHRLRHESNFFWLLCHQLHHSPQRLETITSFYKHPAEIICNSIILSLLLYPLLGLTLEASVWLNIFSGLAEFIYHVNIRTPHWMGYFIQRPEMHRIHHERGKHYKNFGDLPIWDVLFGTYSNPKIIKVECGFRDKREYRLKDMLLFRNVNNPYSKKVLMQKTQIASILLIILGSLQMVGYLVGSPAVRGIGLASAASPLPLVFSHFRGLETFAADFAIDITTKDGQSRYVSLTPRLYDQLHGPYNRRNVYGAIFSHGAMLSSAKELALRDGVMHYGLCDNGPLPKEFGFPGDIKTATIVVKSKTAGSQKTWRYGIVCPS